MQHVPPRSYWSEPMIVPAADIRLVLTTAISQDEAERIARFLVDEEGRLVVQDLDSANGTFLKRLIDDSSTITHAPDFITGRFPNIARANV